MIITRVEKVNKSKFKIYIDEEYQFVLYQRDLYVYGIEEGDEIQEDLYHKILKETVIRRGKQKALDLLKLMDRTEAELRSKLRQADYASAVVEHIMEYIHGFSYLNDARYALNYVRNHKESKSRTILLMELKQKGVSRDLIQVAFDEEYTEVDDENTAIKKQIEKKVRNLDEMTDDQRKKVTNYLLRKGFSYELIKRHLKCIGDDM